LLELGMFTDVVHVLVLGVVLEIGVGPPPARRGRAGVVPPG
jgi:hypothetical protein